MLAARDARVSIVVAVALTIQLFLPALTQAAGIGVFPALVEFKEALRGGEYVRTLTLVNRENATASVLLSTEGQVAQWVSLRGFDDPHTPLEAVEVPGQTELRLMLRVAVPADAANGVHAGTIRFQTRISDTSGGSSGMGVSVGLATEVKVEVTGTEKLAGEVVAISVVDVEVDRPPLRISTTFKNTGNVQATPLIRLVVKDATGTTVGEASFSDTVVDPGQMTIIKSEWDVSGQPAGRYSALVSVFLRENKIDEQELTFEILPRGTLTRSGALDEIALANQPHPGAVAKLVARFRNTGSIDTNAVFLAEVYHGAALVGVLESREKLVPVGEPALLDLFLEVTEGDYKILGKVNYEGKETETKELAFTIAASTAAPMAAQTPPTQTGLVSAETVVLAVLAGALAVVGVGGLVFRMRKRSNHAINRIRPRGREV